MNSLEIICLLIGTNLLSFLGGIYKGAAGGYLAQKLTDQRKAQEHKKYLREKFNDLKNSFPKLLSEMINDIKSDKTNSKTMFGISPKKEINPNSPFALFMYYENEHENLLNKIHKIEQYGFVIDITDSNFPKYKFTDEFIELLKA